MDFNQAGLLLHIADKARQWPNLKKLEMAALAELEKIQEDRPQSVSRHRAIPNTSGDVPQEEEIRR